MLLIGRRQTVTGDLGFAMNGQLQSIKSKLHYFDLWWICCTTSCTNLQQIECCATNQQRIDMLWFCCITNPRLIEVMELALKAGDSQTHLSAESQAEKINKKLSCC